MKKLVMGLLSVLLLVGCSQTTDSAKPQESAKINVYTRDASSGTREAFEKAISLDEGELTKTVSVVASNGDMATKVGNDVNGIGYASITTDFAANNLKALQFEDVDASIATVNDGSYKMQRPFNYVLRADYEDEKLEQLVLAFIDFITLSNEGLSTVEAAGGIVDYSNAMAWKEIASKYPVLTEDNSGYTIRTGGSTSVTKCIEKALQAFQPLAGNVQYAMDQTGSSDGYKRTLGDEADGVNSKEIGFASRNFKDTEDVTTSLAAGSFCKDGVVVVVNKDNELTNITAEQVKNIYTGAIEDFSELN